MGAPREVDTEDAEVERDDGTGDSGVNVGSGLHASKRPWRCPQVLRLINASPAKLELAEINPSKTGNAAARILFMSGSPVC
jgi:hypothetical protein